MISSSKPEGVYYYIFIVLKRKNYFSFIPMTQYSKTTLLTVHRQILNQIFLKTNVVLNTDNCELYCTDHRVESLFGRLITIEPCGTSATVTFIRKHFLFISIILLLGYLTYFLVLWEFKWQKVKFYKPIYSGKCLRYVNYGKI